ncbi:NAD-dependent epimerase/dehydratase family protein [Candidatus Bathyarchaeota archaeon]|nr:NAD-dependent epimerase/dehydratase family protein [Candidatus Bathyarchaeota archaeon]MBS7630323.1 NAD-dependent epimerase/dehydratase family protein [Candidatus Bathyarchaeota archaeon]
MKKILVTGALGQIGLELTPVLRKRYGKDNVIASDIRSPSKNFLNSGPFESLNILNRTDLEEVIKVYDIDTVFHLAAILSATGEKNPQNALEVNLFGVYNILEVSRKLNLTRVFVPSSIAVFGPETSKINAPQDISLRPRTIYGITKVTGELLSNYYYYKFGLDVRGLRWPGIISTSPPGGGTTDYAVEMFYYAVEGKRYKCFVREDTVLPMMYMPDCLKSAIMLMEADLSRLKHHADFNVGGMSFSAGELAAEIKKRIPSFEVDYEPDFRQEIADTWPKSIDDSDARIEWGWSASYNITSMAEEMINKLMKVRNT